MPARGNFARSHGKSSMFVLQRSRRADAPCKPVQRGVVRSAPPPLADIHERWARVRPRQSAAGVSTDTTSTTGFARIGPAPFLFQVLCDAGGPGAAKAGKNLRRDHRYRTTPQKSGAGPISAIPVEEVLSVVTPAPEKRHDARPDRRQPHRSDRPPKPSPPQKWS
jgi:hypothetical protein